MTRLTRRTLAAGGLAGLGLGLSGCGATLLSRPDPPDLYTLTPKSTFDADLPVVDWQMLVEEPTASAGLDTQRIAFLDDLVRLQYFASVAWTDRAPAMVQRLMIESFENSNKIRSVGREGFGLRANYILKSELREFQIERRENAPANAHVRLGVKLTAMPERLIIQNANFSSVVTAGSADPDNFRSLVLALDEALGDVLRDIVEWTLHEGEAHWQANPDNRERFRG